MDGEVARRRLASCQCAQLLLAWLGPTSQRKSVAQEKITGIDEDSASQQIVKMPCGARSTERLNKRDRSAGISSRGAPWRHSSDHRQTAKSKQRHGKSARTPRLFRGNAKCACVCRMAGTRKALPIPRRAPGQGEEEEAGHALWLMLLRPGRPLKPACPNDASHRFAVSTTSFFQTRMSSSPSIERKRSRAGPTQK